MASPVPSSYGPLYDAGKVVLAALGRELLRLEGEGLGTERVEDQVLDLHLGLENIAREQDPAKRADLLAYLQQTYGLLAVGTDPLLRPLLPPIPAQGARLVYFVLGTGVPGRVLGTGVPGRVLGTRVALVPVPDPVPDPTLSPTP